MNCNITEKANYIDDKKDGECISYSMNGNITARNKHHKRLVILFTLF